VTAPPSLGKRWGKEGGQVKESGLWKEARLRKRGGITGEKGMLRTPVPRKKSVTKRRKKGTFWGVSWDERWGGRRRPGDAGFSSGT